MNAKTLAIIVTIAAILLCACPGLFVLFQGGIFALVGVIPGSEIDIMGSSDPQSALLFGVGELCLGAVLLIIGIVAVILVWRRAKSAAAGNPPPA
jgi:uncharacterized membrane protein